jgi:hypothetical protein
VSKTKSTLRLSGRIKQNVCEKCQIVFITRQRHFSHIRAVHQMDYDKVFNTSPGLNTLKKSCHQKLQYRCKKCPKAFQTNYLRAVHVHKEHLNTSYACKDCDNVFLTSAGLYQHKIGHSKPYQCEKCPKAYRSRTILLQHIQIKHLRTYDCLVKIVIKTSNLLVVFINTK